MFESLADKQGVESYKSQLSPQEDRRAIITFLEKLAEKTYADKLSAMTSVGQLYLTPAFSWRDNLNHALVHIDQIEDAKKPLIIMSYVSRNRRKAKAERQCSMEEAIEYIDLYAMRLILEKYGEL